MRSNADEAAGDLAAFERGPVRTPRARSKGIREGKGLIKATVSLRSRMDLRIVFLMFGLVWMKSLEVIRDVVIGQRHVSDLFLPSFMGLWREIDMLLAGIDEATTL